MVIHLKHFRTIVLTLSLCVALGISSTLAAAITQQSPQRLQQTITTLNKARVKIVKSRLEKGETEQTMEKELKDFQLFLSYLDGRIYYYCEQLSRNSGSDALIGLPCPVSVDGTLEITQHGSIPEISSQTDDEKVATLDSGFAASLGEFDDMLLKEQEQISLHVPSRREGGSDGGSGSGTGEGETGADGNGQKNGNSDRSAKKADSGEGGVAQAPGDTGSSSQTRLPPTRGSKDLSESDDDIVARQLKEAAEQETDPEVKARLWEEYRKYKEK